MNHIETVVAILSLQLNLLLLGWVICKVGKVHPLMSLIYGSRGAGLPGKPLRILEMTVRELIFFHCEHTNRAVLCRKRLKAQTIEKSFHPHKYSDSPMSASVELNKSKSMKTLQK